MKPLSNLIGSIPASATIAINDKAKALKAAGRDIVALAGGDPDFDTPVHIQEAAFAAIRAGDTHYPASRGTPALPPSRKQSTASSSIHRPRCWWDRAANS